LREPLALILFGLVASVEVGDDREALRGIEGFQMVEVLVRDPPIAAKRLLSRDLLAKRKRPAFEMLPQHRQRAVLAARELGLGEPGRAHDRA
jgi:hypothetical protein